MLATTVASAQPASDDDACIAQPTRGCVVALALGVARGADRDQLRDYQLRQVARAQAALGDAAAARETLAEIDNRTREEGLVLAREIGRVGDDVAAWHMVFAHMDAGRFREALIEARGLSRSDQVSVYVTIAEKLPQ